MTPPSPETGPDIVAIGASAGGFKAIESLLSRLPPSLPAAILVVLHRSAEYRSYLPEILQRRWGGPVVIAQEGEALRPGALYLGLPDRHLTIGKGGRVRLLKDGAYRGHTIDTLFQSLARHAGPRTVAVVLSGMLKDGSVGLQAIRAAGGVALVQDPEEAAFAKMPQSAIDCGPVDFVGTIGELAEEIRRRLAEVDCDAPPAPAFTARRLRRPASRTRLPVGR